MGKDSEVGGVISRLRLNSRSDYEAWQKCDLSARRSCRCGRTASILQTRVEKGWRAHAGADRRDTRGQEELVGPDGVRKSGQSWRDLLMDMKQRGPEIAPDSRSATAPRLREGDRASSYRSTQTSTGIGFARPPRADQDRPSVQAT